MTQYRRTTSFLTRKKSTKPWTKRARRQQDKYITPDHSLVRGRWLRVVSGPDDPLREAERIQGEYAEMVAAYQAKVAQLLQDAYGIALRLQRQRTHFERFQVHPFWTQTGQKPQRSSISKWILLFMMQATTTDMHKRAGKFALMLDGLMLDQVEIDAVVARIKALGGLGAAADFPRVLCGRRLSFRRDQATGRMALR